MFAIRKVYLFILLLPLLLFAGCQQKVYLMPPPIGLHPESQLFYMSDEDKKDDNLLYTLYATNRIPINKLNSSIGYTIFPSDTLELGYVVYSVGDEDMSWDDLYEQSLKKNRDTNLLLIPKHIREGAEYHKDADINQTSDRAEGFFDRINRAIDMSFDKDLTVYVHGANSNFYRATAQGAQFYHFTGHNSVVLSFSWPSAENLLKYKTDVLHAKKTIPAFAQLIEILALHIKARNINILAYSAGAQVAAPGLAYLRNLYPTQSSQKLKERFRIGEVYFAAPDTAFSPFVKRYLTFKDMVGRTTINLNHNDKILRLAAFQNGVSRLGRPNATELNEEETEIIIAALETPKLNVLDVGGSEALNLGGAHNSWYNHPWVSNDLLMLFLFNAPPEERGLIAFYNEHGVKHYHFPQNYEQKIRPIIAEHLLKKNRQEQKALQTK
ncbi:MAG: alpha/beta hydrolase [Thermodesulfobacteriota bacterium]|nr:alpha/beta hydrolase [Thermodesulfobacteriota bacterium]